MCIFGIQAGLTRNTYNRETVRIQEVYYEPDKIKQRWQEELRGGEWVKHGPTIHYDFDGTGGEIYFYLDGEGVKVYRSKNGTLQRD